MSLGALVACADFLLCVFLCDGTVALCNCLKDTKTFGLGFVKGRVWGHVATAPGGAQRWWGGGQTWHATNTPRPCHTGKGLSDWSIFGECFSRQTLGRFYGLIIEAIYWLSESHTCEIQQTRTNTYTNMEKQTRGENEISNSGKTASHRWTHFRKNMQRITRLHIKTYSINLHKTTIHGLHGKSRA